LNYFCKRNQVLSNKKGPLPYIGLTVVVFLFSVISSIVVQKTMAADISVNGIRVGSSNGSTRFVVDLNREVTPKIISLADPYRVVIDLPEVKWNLKGQGRGTGKGVVSNYRYGHFQAGVSRIVLDLKGPARIKKTFTLSPSGAYKYRLVVDLENTSRANFLAALKPKKREPRMAAAAPPRAIKKRTKNAQRIIVVDAGHGGNDPGSPSSIGISEKRITLQTARVLKKELEKNGNFKVYLSRDRDVYVPHRRRFGVARKHQADLFISLHGDSFKSNKVRGATVYTLSERASDSEAAALARRENKSDIIAGIDLEEETDDVSSILIDLARRETMNYSARLATLLVPELKRNINLRKNTHRFANFLVLKAPDVPSILIEMGYLTNKADARRMASKEGQQKIAKSIRQAVEKYFTTISAEGY
jgi:N-acetylmuramoyl-L-alanine amidase